jgi:hypothetical protein
MGNMIDVGQALLDLESPEQGPGAGPAVLLDTRETTSHLRLENVVSKQYAKAKKSERRAIHGRLKEMLNSMATGEHGITAMQVGQRWAGDVGHCGGRTSRHDVCGRPSWLPNSCDMPLCPWYQQSRAQKAGKILQKLWMNGSIVNPHFATYTVQNVNDLAGGWSEIRSALVGLHRRAYIKARCRGGFRALETTVSKSDGRWNAHGHELLDGEFLAQYPMTDIDRRAGQWVVKQEHPGLARLWTMECQGMRRQADGKMAPRYPTLYRKGINVDCPEDWYLVNIKAADYGAISEIAKYVAKGDEIVQAGPGKIVEYLNARRNRRMLQGFGSMYKVAFMEDEGEEEAYEAPTAPGECPYSDCPEPRQPAWEFVCTGPPDGWEPTRDNRTGRYRLHLEGLAPPESEKDLDYRVGIVEKEIDQSENNIWVEVEL